MLAAPSAPAGNVSAAQRPVPLRRRPDLVISRISYRGVVSPVVKDPLALKYYRLQPEQAAVFELLDGRHSIEELREQLQRQHPTIPVTRTDVQVLITDLHEKGLLISERPGQAVGLLQARWKRKLQSLRSALLNPLYIKLPGWDPDRLLTRLDPWVGGVFRPRAMLPILLFTAIAYLFVAVRLRDMQQRLPEFQQFFGWPNLIYLYLTLAGAKILHEFGHGLACKHFGAECHSMGVMLLVFSPTLYCDATDAWMIRNKWKRILIGAAGMYVEVILASIAVFIWWSTQPGLLNHLCLNLFFVSTVTTVIFNANPLMRFDGYFMLADFLEIPNLRPKADKLLQETFAKYCLGIEPRNDPFMPTSGRGWFIAFAIAAFLYRWFVTWAIILFLYTVLKPYRLQSIGIAMAVGSVAAMLYGMGKNLYQTLNMPRSEPLSRVKVTLTLLALAGTVVALLFVPFPWYLEAPFTLQPAGVQHIYNPLPGELLELHVAAGQRVSRGTVLARLGNRELEDRLRKLTSERVSQAHDIALYREQGRRDDQLVAEERQRGLRQQEDELREELARLQLVAPIDGVIVAPPRTPPPRVAAATERLSAWYGTPLDLQNLGAQLVERTHVCSLAPSAEFEAVLLIDQGDRSEAAVGRPVSLKLDLLPAVELSGTMAAIADTYLDEAPPALSNKYGGPLATTTDPRGREQLTSLAYQATVRLAGVDATLLRAGLRGNARLFVGRRSVADWIWRYVRNTFKFRL